MAWLTARYLIESEPELIEKRAAALALEQSVECPLEAIGSDFGLNEIVARVDSIREAGERRYLVDVKIATATTGGERVKASRSMVKVATVPRTSASRSVVIWSTAWQLTQTRAGGRWRVPHVQKCLAACFV